MEETGARGPDCYRNQLTDREPTAALLTDGLYIPAKYGSLGATSSGVGDKVHGQDCSRIEKGARARGESGWVN